MRPPAGYSAKGPLPFVVLVDVAELALRAFGSVPNALTPNEWTDGLSGAPRRINRIKGRFSPDIPDEGHDSGKNLIVGLRCGPEARQAEGIGVTGQ
jgi:hypothetical protein